MFTVDVLKERSLVIWLTVLLWIFNSSVITGSVWRGGAINPTLGSPAALRWHN